MEKFMVSVGSIYEYPNNTKNINYIVYDENDEKRKYSVNLNDCKRPEKSTEIVDDSNDFVNGFKVVKTNNGEYAYLREEDNLLLPFRYDLAFNFNEYGFAIVCKDGKVTWIDRDFKFLNIQGEMVEDNTDSWDNFDGFSGISEFSEGEIPLSRLFICDDQEVCYFSTDGIIKEFSIYDGKINKDLSIKCFYNGTSFDDDGHAKCDNGVLFAKGFYVSYEDLIIFSLESGYVDSLIERSSKLYK